MEGQITGQADLAKDWHRRAGDLAQACAGSFAGEESARLADLATLLANTPRPVGELLGWPASAVRVEAAPADGALAAVLRLIETCRGGYLLSWGAGGGHLASVVLPGGAEVTLGADSAGLALIGALALAFAEREPLRVQGTPLYRPDSIRLN